MTGSRTERLRFLPATIAVVAIVGIAIVLFMLVRHWIATPPSSKRSVVQEVRLIRPPPPPDVEPPPPPPPEEEVDLPEPEAQPEAPTDAPPPGEQLGLDADGSAGGDGFGLVARKGGRDLLSTGGSAIAWYANVIKGEVLNSLENESNVRRGSYSVSVRIWVRPDGTIERYRLAQSTGDPERDRAIEAALGRIGRFSQPPPAELPQPISLRLVSRA